MRTRVIADSHEQDLRGDADLYKVYVAASAAGQLGERLLIRSQLPLATLAPALREQFARTDPRIAVREIRSLEERIAASIAEYRHRMRLMQAFSLTAALFCLLGVYGVMSRAVARRRQELGLRADLGARRRDLAGLVLREGLAIGSLGAALGLALGLAATRALESMIWGVPRTDPLTFVAIAVLLLVLTTLATLLPAGRAAAVEPMMTLRG